MIRRPVNRGDRGDTARWARRQEHILNGAVRLFAERGYSDTDTQLLAEKLQVDKGTLYRYSRSKRDLFLAARDILDIAFRDADKKN